MLSCHLNSCLQANIITYSRSDKRIIDNYALRQTTNAIMLVPCNEWMEQLLNIIISSCSKSEVGMAKNSGFVWTVVWNGGQNMVFRNIRIRVVGAWIGKPGEKLLLLQFFKMWGWNGMAKNAGVVWTEGWNGGQNAVFRNIRIRVVGAWTWKPGEKLLLLQYRASPLSLPMETFVGLCRRVMPALLHVPL